MGKSRIYEKNSGWIWNGNLDSEGITWGGCLESIDEMLRNGVTIPSLKNFDNVILMTETSEGIPTADYVHRVYRALGERGILGRVKGVIVGRPKAWEFDKQHDTEQKEIYRNDQREIIKNTFRNYNSTAPIVQNIDFGHTEPQIPIPFGSKIRLSSVNKKNLFEFLICKY